MFFNRFVQKNHAAKRLLFFAIFFFCSASAAFGQDYYVTRPDPRVLGHGSYNVSLHLVPNGGLLLGLKVGFFERLQIGLTYGGSNIIGAGDIDLYSFPGVQAKVAILKEPELPLSLAVGFDSQNSVWSEQVNQPGAYLVLGKEIPLGWLAFDLAFGAGYDFLNQWGWRGWHVYAAPSIILGQAFNITPELVVYPEYGINLGMSAGWQITKGTGIEFCLSDMFAETDPNWTRSVRFQLTQEF
ncbi:hypothetical protein GX441_08995 [bacterium]|nr:hypothetical protein [bacterium]